MRNDPTTYCPQGFADSENEDGTLTMGTWRNFVPENSIFHTQLSNQNAGRPTQTASEIRDHLKKYFSSDSGKLAWQEGKVFYRK
jgi:hypothetical protein